MKRPLEIENGLAAAAPAAAGASAAASGAWRVLWATAWRDFTLEVREREAANAMLFYALLVIVIFSFAFTAEASLTLRVGGGLLWVAFLFAGLVALDRAFLREAPGDCLAGLVASPAPRAAVLAGKFAATYAMMLIIEAVLLPVFAIMFNAPAAARWGGIVLTVLLGTWALAANGTYFSALGNHARQRTLLLPLLLLPVAIPAIIAMVQATQVFLAGDGGADFWLKLLLGYDVIFTALGALLADVVLEAE
ncbi:MAG: heme exporter protein CcmB [Terriglobales bacterium]